MAKRFTDTDKWKRDWFSQLNPTAKLTWIYILDECDHRGVYPANFRRLSFDLGVNVTMAQFEEWFDKKFIKIAEDKYFIPSFVIFQQGLTLNPNNNAHRPIIEFLTEIKMISKFNILASPSAGASEGQTRGPGKGKGKSNGKIVCISSKSSNSNKSVDAQPAGASFAAISNYSEIQEIIQKRKLTQAVQHSWNEAFPDPQWVCHQVRKAVAWEIANKRVKKDFARFMTNWMLKDWDKRAAAGKGQINTTPLKLEEIE